MIFPHLVERLCADTGLGEKRVRRALDLLRRKDFVYWAHDGSFLFAEKIRYHLRIQNPSYLSNVKKYLDEILPKTQPAFIQRVEALFSQMQLSCINAKTTNFNLPNRTFSLERSLAEILDVVRLHANGG